MKNQISSWAVSLAVSTNNGGILLPFLGTASPEALTKDYVDNQGKTNFLLWTAAHGAYQCHLAQPHPTNYKSAPKTLQNLNEWEDFSYLKQWDEVLLILLRRGVFSAKALDQKEESGEKRGIIHLLAEIGNIQLMQAFLNSGANVTLKDGKGKTALDYAKHNPRMQSQMTHVINKKIKEQEEMVAAVERKVLEKMLADEKEELEKMNTLETKGLEELEQEENKIQKEKRKAVEKEEARSAESLITALSKKDYFTISAMLEKADCPILEALNSFNGLKEDRGVYIPLVNRLKGLSGEKANTYSLSEVMEEWSTLLLLAQLVENDKPKSSLFLPSSSQPDNKVVHHGMSIEDLVDFLKSELKNLAEDSKNSKPWKTYVFEKTMKDYPDQKIDNSIENTQVQTSESEFEIEEGPQKEKLKIKK